MAQTATEICERLDEAIAPVIERCRTETDAPLDVFRGATVGFLLKTGMALAFDAGVSRAELKRIIDRTLTGFYG